MASQYQVNLQIGAGTYFYQEFYMTNPDFTPIDLTGVQISGAISKHPGSVDALSEDYATSSAAISFNTGVVDALSGNYFLEMSDEMTSKLEEGKYVFDVVIRTVQGHFIEAVSGLVFVNKAFGLVRNQETDVP